MNNIYPNDRSNGISIGASLKTYLKKEIEKICTSMLDEIRREDDEEAKNLKINEVKVADIVFAFNNEKLIRLLRKRGTFI